MMNSGLSAFEDISHKYEIDGYSDGEHRHWRQFLGDSHPQEQVQEQEVKEKIHCMGAAHSPKTLP